MIRLLMSRVGGAVCLSILLSSLACDQAINDAITDNTPADAGTDRPLDPFDVVRARVRNESATRADVTLRFIRDVKVVHLAFVRVLPGTVTTVSSPEAVDMVELSGISDGGRALPGETFVFGVDFDETTPAEYLVRGDSGSGSEPSPFPSGMTSLSLLWPEDDLTLPLGSTLDVRWDDDAETPGAVVSILLRPVGSANEDDWIQTSPAVGAALDGVNDQITIVLEGVDPGTYEIVARIADGGKTETSVAPGLVQVVRDPFNTAPSLKVLSPVAPVRVRADEPLLVRWADADPDDNATITFALESTNRTAGPIESLGISPPIAEDPDGPNADASILVIRDVLPGLYDLVATIDDGQLVGTDRVGGAVLILPDPNNDAPQLELIEPASDVHVAAGGTVLVRWIDSDDNDDARISLHLDPGVGPVAWNGDELVLVPSLRENEEGSGDRETLRIPGDLASGPYRLVGMITDGLTQVVTKAPGVVFVEARATTPTDGDDGIDNGDGGGGPGGGSGGPGDGDGGGTGPGDPGSNVTVTILGSAADAAVVQSQPFDILIETGDSQSIERRRFFLTNLPYGGNLRVDVTPTEVPDAKRFTTTIRTDVVPNDSWPRQFDFEIETIVDGQIDLYVGPRPIWIRQEVEVVELVPIGNPCNGDGPVRSASEPFARVELVWYGGGFDFEDSRREVQFWLTSDGSVPEDGLEDATHELVFRHNSSPNKFRSFRLAVEPVANEVLDAEHPSGPVMPVTVGANVEPGRYYVVTVLDPNSPDRTVSTPYPEQIEFCGPLN